MNFVEVVAPQCRIYAVPNASRRTAGGKASNAVPGLSKGVPDLCITIPGGRVAYIEVKAPKGSLKPEQIDWRDWLNANRVPYALCRSIEDTRAFVASLGIQTREAEPA